MTRYSQVSIQDLIPYYLFLTCIEKDADTGEPGWGGDGCTEAECGEVVGVSR